MTDKKTPAIEAERCGERTDAFRLTCDRPARHVRSASPDDWHEAASSTVQHQNTQAWTLVVTSTEAVRWAPRSWEIPAAPDASED